MDVWSHDHADHLERLKRLDGKKEKNKATGGVRKVMGNLRFPLDKTYHGCPRVSLTILKCSITTEGVIHTWSLSAQESSRKYIS